MYSPQDRCRFPCSFGLKTLLILVALLAAWLAYQVHWIQQRHAFLAEQLARHRAICETDDDLLATDNLWKHRLHSDSQPPSLLWLFGEEAVGELLLPISDNDLTLRDYAYWM